MASVQVSDMESGEGMDRATLSLTGAQEALLRAVAATDTPIITVFIQGRPLDMTLASELSDALLTAWAMPHSPMIPLRFRPVLRQRPHLCGSR